MKAVLLAKDLGKMADKVESAQSVPTLVTRGTVSLARMRTAVRESIWRLN